MTRKQLKTLANLFLELGQSVHRADEIVKDVKKTPDTVYLDASVNVLAKDVAKHRETVLSVVMLDLAYGDEK